MDDYVLRCGISQDKYSKSHIIDFLKICYSIIKTFKVFLKLSLLVEDIKAGEKDSFFPILK